jgi:hypothetical protein
VSQPGELEHVVVEGRADEVREAGTLELVLARGIEVDHHDVALVLPELVGDDAAEAAVTADDDVGAQLVDPSLHRVSPEKVPEVAFDDHLRDDRGQVQDVPEPGEDEGHREDAAGERLRDDVAVADRGERDDRQVRRVGERQALEQPVAGNPITE